MSKNLNHFNNKNYKKRKTLKIKNKTYNGSINIHGSNEEKGLFSPQKVIEDIPETELLVNYQQPTHRRAQSNSHIMSFGVTPQFKKVGSP